MNIIKRSLGALLLALGMTAIFLSLASALGILVVMACPFIAMWCGAYFWQQAK